MQIIPARENATPHGWCTLEPVAICRDKLQKLPFKLTHSLAGNPLFQIDQLLAVAKYAKNVYFDAGNVSIDDRWGNIPVPNLPVEEVISRVENNGAWIILKEMEKISPEYAAVMDEFTAFVHGLYGEGADERFLKPEMLVIISSPGRLTPFHFDAEVNFLAQIIGEKHVWICDPSDRTVVTDEDIEKYYNQQNVGTYRKGVETHATSYVLQPGEAVHIPTHAAHWIKNGNGVSVSLSLNFEQPFSAYHDALRANWIMRKFGMRPLPAGRDARRDKLKSTLLKAGTRTLGPMLSKARTLIK